MVEMFSTEIDFHRELRKGDTFTVIYEALTADGEPITWGSGSEMTGRVPAAEFRQSRAHLFGGVVRRRVGQGAYFGLDGQSKRRAFLGSPVASSRITSTFAMRMHPILNTWRTHLGVDYGAPMGTPVRSVGDGTVEMAGWQNGYGNVVQIKHSNDRATTYAHLSRIDVRKGQRVEQGAPGRRRRRHGLGHRPAPALRVQVRASSRTAGHGQGVRGHDDPGRRQRRSSLRTWRRPGRSSRSPRWPAAAATASEPARRLTQQVHQRAGGCALHDADA